MSFDWWTFALQIANFAILVWLLHRYLYKPVLRMVDARRAGIEKERAEAAEAVKRAAEELEKARADRAAIQAERAEIIAAAHVEAEALVAKRKAEADREAAELKEQVKKSLAAEREAAAGDMRRASLDLAVGIARRLLDELPLEYRTEAWLHRIEQYLDALGPEEKAALLEGVEGEGGLRIVGAAAFPETVVKHWTERLRAVLGRDVEIEFVEEPDLVAGVELHFPTSVLHFSWRSTLNTIRAEIEDGVKTR